MKKEILFTFRYRWYRFTHWEFWPMWAIYLPCISYYIWISIKCRSLGFFKAVNPSMIHGGITLENKNFVNKLIPQKFRAKSFLIKKNQEKGDVLELIKHNNLMYPLILKPNNGYRGRNVELIRDEAGLENYLENFGNEDLLLEEYVDLCSEIGIFYIKFPNSEKGFISGIVEKKGIEVAGDGKSTLGELIKYNLRYHKFYPHIFKNSAFRENFIPEEGERILLSSIGNHARGATFYDSSYKITDKLEDLFNEICSDMDGFHYGRFDVKFNSWKDLENGRNFKIIELNGAASEPTFIYDPENFYLFAITEIMVHWDYMYQIAKTNKEKGHGFTNNGECWSLFKEYNPFSI